MSYTVTQRTSEIGIRVALGAQAADVFRAVVGEGLRFALLGVRNRRLVGSWLFTRLLQSFLYGVSASDPLTFSGVAILLSLVALAASFLPGSPGHSRGPHHRAALRIAASLPRQRRLFFKDRGKLFPSRCVHTSELHAHTAF